MRFFSQTEKGLVESGAVIKKVWNVSDYEASADDDGVCTLNNIDISTKHVVEVPSHKIVVKSDSKSLVCGNCHQYENMENIKVFTTGLGKKKHPKKTFITTNGNIRDGVLDSYLMKARNILDFEIVDNGFLPMLWEIDEKEDVYNSENWIKQIRV